VTSATNARAESSVRFLDARSGRDVRAFAGTTILASSAALSWPGLLVETGRNEGWCVDQIAVAKHYLAINLDDRPLAFDVLDGGRARRVVMNPGDLWTCPAGEAFTHRVAMPAVFGLVLLDPDRLERASGVPTRLARNYALRAASMEHVVRALIAETERGGENGVAFAEALGTALAVQLARVAGARVERPRPGALTSTRLRAVLELIEGRLEQGVTIEAMAARVGLSPFHFARAFKQATGKSPHRFLLERRLERARAAIERGDGEALGAIALRLGFADQSHLTRLFRRRYGVTPASLRR
jgi:AraC family transcriptional regulator